MLSSASAYRNPDEIDVQWMKGIGPRRAAALKDSGIATVRDLLYHFPRRYLDRSMIVPFQKMYDHTGFVAYSRNTSVDYQAHVE